MLGASDEDRLAFLQTLALSVSHLVVPMKDMLKDLSVAIGSRMCARLGKVVYQSVEFSLPAGQLPFWSEKFQGFTDAEARGGLLCTPGT